MTTPTMIGVPRWYWYRTYSVVRAMYDPTVSRYDAYRRVGHLPWDMFMYAWTMRHDKKAI